MDESVKRLAQHLLEIGFEEMPDRERRVIQRVAHRLQVSRNINREFVDTRSFGERLSDKVAAFGGSWTFIIIFAVVLLAWAMLNSEILKGTAFDPYPYIFLNLILSMIAAIQAPIIMMSQNRQGARDRLAAANDYEVNLKAELEIMALHEKLDQMRSRHLEALLVSQEQQLEMLKSLAEEKRTSGSQ